MRYLLDLTTRSRRVESSAEGSAIGRAVAVTMGREMEIPLFPWTGKISSFHP
jgi:hypothetical protein